MIAMQKAISNITDNHHIGRPLNDYQHLSMMAGRLANCNKNNVTWLFYLYY